MGHSPAKKHNKTRPLPCLTVGLNASLRLDGLSAPLMVLPNLRRIFLNELPLLENPKPKLWLIALILAKDPEIPAIVRQVRDHGHAYPDEPFEWLGTLLVYKLPDLTR